MTLTNNVRLQPCVFTADFTEQTAAETAAEIAVGATMEGADPATNGDWTYSATHEGRTGEVASTYGNVSIDLDGGPGVQYSGPAGAAVRVVVKGFDVAEGAISVPEAGDACVAAVLLNNDVIAYADEGSTSEIDTETAVEFNIDTYVGGLQTNDVIRVAIVSFSEETIDWDVAAGGTINII